jgi:hypothetical protein
MRSLLGQSFFFTLYQGTPLAVPPRTQTDRGFRVCVRTRKSSPQGLKPDIFSIVYGTTKEAAEKLLFLKGTAFRPYIVVRQPSGL